MVIAAKVDISRHARKAVKPLLFSTKKSDIMRVHQLFVYGDSERVDHRAHLAHWKPPILSQGAACMRLSSHRMDIPGLD